MRASALRVGGRGPRAAGERWVIAALAVVLAAGVAGYLAGPMPAAYLLSVAALPAGVLAACAGLYRGGRRGEARVLLQRVAAGALWGVAAIAVYDLYKPLAKAVFGYGLDPYRAMPVFGHLLSGLPAGSDGALLLGWAYHLWIAAACGVLFALLWARGGIAAGVLWGLVLQGARLAVYPELQALLTVDSELLVVGVIGHVVWGAVLGAGVRGMRLGHG